MKTDDWRELRIKVFGKGQRERFVSLSPPTAKAIWEYQVKERPRTFYSELFLARGAVPMTPNSLSQMLERRSIAAGIRRVNPHLLRHTFAFSWARAGGPLHALQSLLGHSTPAMSLRYGRIASTDAGELHRQFSPVERLGLRFREKR